MIASDETQALERRRRPLRTAFTIAALAFLAGLALMAWALTRWGPVRPMARGDDLVSAKMPPATVITPPAGEAAAVPIAPSIATPTLSDDPRIADLEARMARIDLRAAAAAGNAARAEGLLIAFAARRAIDRGVALGYLEGDLRARFGTTQPRAVGTIIAASQAPATLEALQQGLIALKPKLSGATANESWWDSTRRTLAGLVVVRREGSGSPAPDQRIARAEARLASGQVDGALAEIARLPGRAAAESWMVMARRHIEAHRALDVIEAAALTEDDVPAAAPAPDAILARPL
ncbi:MAG: hypothetical protein ACKVOP_03230 [Sphingomonadaceae bacterium]